MGRMEKKTDVGIWEAKLVWADLRIWYSKAKDTKRRRLRHSLSLALIMCLLHLIEALRAGVSFRCR